MSADLFSSHNIAIILVQPQMGENIGAAARAMKNFSLTDLRIVKPRDGWPNEKAKNMSVGALEIIEKARIYTSLPDALENLEYVYAASATSRDMNKNYILSRDLANEVVNYKRIGIMFGRESSGLNNEEISYANKIVTIDTDIHFSSLNIAHAVAVISYELFQSIKQDRADVNDLDEIATHGDLEYFFKHLFDALEQNSFFRTKDKKVHMQLKIRNLFNKIDHLSKQEVQTLRGILTNLTKK